MRVWVSVLQLLQYHPLVLDCQLAFGAEAEICVLGMTAVLEADQSSVGYLVSHPGCIQVQFWLLEAGRAGGEGA